MPDDSPRFYVKTDGRTVGPLTLRQLERLNVHGDVGPDDQVSTDGVEWVPLCDLVELNPEPATGSEPEPLDNAIAPVPTVSTSVPSSPVPLLQVSPPGGVTSSFVGVGIALAVGLLGAWVLFGHRAEAPVTTKDLVSSVPPIPETPSETDPRPADEPTSTSSSSLPENEDSTSPTSTDPVAEPESPDRDDPTPPTEVRNTELELLERKYSIRIIAHPATRPLMCGSLSIEASPLSPEKLAEAVEPLARELNLFPKQLIERSGLKAIVLLDNAKLETDWAGIACCGEQTILLDVDALSLYATMCRGKWATVSHEVFHIIDWTDGDRLDRDPAWEKLNPEGFSYGQGGWNVERSPNLLKMDMSLAGFLNQYSKAALAEDKAEVFEAMIVDYRLVEYRTKRDKILKAKVAVMKERLEKFCPEINSSFWYRMRRRYGDRPYKVELAESLKDVKKNPNSGAAQFNRGYAFLKTGYYSLALAAFRMARKLPPGEFMIAWIYSHLGDHKLAIYYASTLLDRDLPPSRENTELRADAQLLRGKSHFVRGDLADAVADLTRAISADPGNVSAYWWRSYVFKELGEREAYERDRRQIRELQDSPESLSESDR